MEGLARIDFDTYSGQVIRVGNDKELPEVYEELPSRLIGFVVEYVYNR